MRHIALITIMIIGCQSPQELKRVEAFRASLSKSADAIATKQDATLVALHEQTDKLNAIKDQLTNLATAKEVIKSEDEPDQADPANDSHTATNQAVSPVPVSLFVTSTEGCIPCRRLWAAVEEGKFAGFDVRHSTHFVGLVSYPAIRFQDATSPTGWRVIYGYTDETPGQLRRRLLKEARAEAKAARLRMRWNIVGNWNPSIEQTRRHLEQEHGVITTGMTHQQMLDLHDSLHGTSTSIITQPIRQFGTLTSRVRIFNRGTYCPSGRCPR